MKGLIFQIIFQKDNGPIESEEAAKIAREVGQALEGLLGRVRGSVGGVSMSFGGHSIDR